MFWVSYIFNDAQLIIPYTHARVNMELAATITEIAELST